MTERSSAQSHESIDFLFGDQCRTLTKRETLTYEVGRSNISEPQYFLRITGNSGKGTWCKDWILGEDIDRVIADQRGLTGKRLHHLQSGNSRNTGGFVLAVLEHLGLVKNRDHVQNSSFRRLIEIEN